MILGIARFAHIACALIGIGSGSALLLGILAGRFRRRWATIFLKCALVTCVTGLLFPRTSFLLTHRASILIIYLSAVAIVAWRRYALAGIWAPAFAMSINIALGLEVLVAVAHIFTYSQFFHALSPAHAGPLFCIVEFVIILPFAGVVFLILKRYRTDRSVQSQLSAE